MVCIPGSNVSDGGLIMPALEKARLFVMMRHIYVRGITTVSHLLLQIKMLSLFSRFWRNCFLLWQVNSSKWTVDGGSKHLTCGWDKDSTPSDTMPLSNCTSDYCYFLSSFYLFCFIYYFKYFICHSSYSLNSSIPTNMVTFIHPNVNIFQGSKTSVITFLLLRITMRHEVYTVFDKTRKGRDGSC